ncbi:arginine repressor [Ruminococcaceae bacterium OttesenSCG-928-I18]|nr:arginine repressor [Ruminococcaceae bacterium OttesenSCG-928-I18]
MAKERDHQKEARQKKIAELVEGRSIQTQMELLQELKQAGFDVTQATISRDIRELQIGKSVGEGGRVCYVLTRNRETKRRFEMIFAESVLSADIASNIILVKCQTGMANAACELFDRESQLWGDVVGTLSGDNTFLILMRSEEEARALCQKLQNYIPQQP